MIVNASGAILTALHVVDDAARIRLGFVDGTRSSGRIVSADPENDIAVLMPDRPPETIVPAVLGGAGQVGDEAYAVGHPLGFVGSLTSGVISGLERTVEAPGRPDAPRADPVRRRRQPGELRRPPAQPGWPGDRDRHEPGQPVT